MNGKGDIRREAGETDRGDRDVALRGGAAGQQERGEKQPQDGRREDPPHGHSLRRMEQPKSGEGFDVTATPELGIITVPQGIPKDVEKILKDGGYIRGAGGLKGIW